MHAEQLAELLSPPETVCPCQLYTVMSPRPAIKRPVQRQSELFAICFLSVVSANSVRAERGDDIAAACGQLRTHFEQRKQASTWIFT